MFDPFLLILTLVFAGIGMAVSARLKSVFHKYGEVGLRSGLSGAQVAQRMLKESGIHDVTVESVPGKLTDHYNPLNKTVNLSPEVFSGRSISAAAVAAHECGHAVQHARQYPWLQMRSQLVPIVNFSSKALNWVYIAMIVLAFSANLYNQALLAIIILQSAITLFTVITLPVEMDASNRALVWLRGSGVALPGAEMDGASTALKWAGRTYIVAALASLATLAYFIMKYMGRRD
ncbi:MAG: zinc metallopeptidase [Flavobacteriales bacterium]|nr:zinc metallopeptidase [Flavobacteriales bacterium]